MAKPSLKKLSAFVLEKLPVIAALLLGAGLLTHYAVSRIGTNPAPTISADLPDLSPEELAQRLQEGHEQAREVALQAKAKAAAQGQVAEREPVGSADEGEKPKLRASRDGVPGRDAQAAREQPLRQTGREQVREPVREAAASERRAPARAAGEQASRVEPQVLPPPPPRDVQPPLELAEAKPPVQEDRSLLGRMSDISGRMASAAKRVTVDPVVNASGKAWEKTTEGAASVRDFVKRVF